MTTPNVTLAKLLAARIPIVQYPRVGCPKGETQPWVDEKFNKAPIVDGGTLSVIDKV